MRIALCSQPFVNGDMLANYNTIANILPQLNDVQLVCFGEGFLQGFDSLVWNYDRDKYTAVSQNHPIIADIAQLAVVHHVAISFGYIEMYDGDIYSSNMVIDSSGSIIHNYRRCSVGWKVEQCTDIRYRQGSAFGAFTLCNVTFAVGLCGDMWYDDNIQLVNNVYHDILLWPVFIDYDIDSWNNTALTEYTMQAGKIGGKVLLINSISTSCSIAHGGAFYFDKGELIDQVPLGTQGILVVEV